MTNNITRREWIRHIKGILTDTAALIMVLLDDWEEMPDADKQDALEQIKGKIVTALTMMQGRTVF